MLHKFIHLKCGKAGFSEAQSSKVLSNSPDMPPKALQGTQLIKILRMCPITQNE